MGEAPERREASVNPRNAILREGPYVSLLRSPEVTKGARKTQEQNKSDVQKAGNVVVQLRDMHGRVVARPNYYKEVGTKAEAQAEVDRLLGELDKVGYKKFRRSDGAMYYDGDIRKTYPLIQRINDICRDFNMRSPFSSPKRNFSESTGVYY